MPGLHDYRNRARFDDERLGEQRDGVIAHPLQHVLWRDACDVAHHGERSAADVRQLLAGLEAALQTVRDVLQQQVAGMPAEGIVDDAQLLDVDDRHGVASAPLRRVAEQARQAIAEQ